MCGCLEDAANGRRPAHFNVAHIICYGFLIWQFILSSMSSVVVHIPHLAIQSAISPYIYIYIYGDIYPFKHLYGNSVCMCGKRSTIRVALFISNSITLTLIAEIIHQQSFTYNFIKRNLQHTRTNPFEVVYWSVYQHHQQTQSIWPFFSVTLFQGFVFLSSGQSMLLFFIFAF